MKIGMVIVLLSLITCTTTVISGTVFSDLLELRMKLFITLIAVNLAIVILIYAVVKLL